MAFLPGLTTERSSQNVKRRSKRREAGKKSGYRISLADINKTTGQSDCNVVARYRNDGNANNTGKRETLPPLEEVERNCVAKANFNEEDKSKPLKLPKCPSALIDKKSMFWIEPLGLWVPLRKGRRLYEKFSSGINLLCKDPDYSMDPFPHIPRCDHARSWSAVKIERQKFHELRELRNKQLLEKTLERYHNMQEFWLEQMNNRTEILHATPSHVRLQNFRKTTGFLAPLNETQRLERLQERQERQREWEEAWRLACEMREKAGRKKNPRNILPQIIVTDYEFVFACDEHVNTNNQSRDLYFEESYHVICRPVQYICDENFKTQPLSTRMQGFQNKEPTPGVCDPYTGFDPTENVTTSFDPSENEPESFEPSGKKSRSFDPYGSFATTETREFEPYTRLDHMDKIPGELPPGNMVDSPRDENAGIKECDGSTSESNITQDSLLVTSYTCSGSSLDTVVAEVRMTEEIKHADNTADLMSQLVPVPLGVSSGKILDPQLTASSALDVYHTADQARLHNEKHDKKGGAWLPKKHDVSPYLQIDLGHVTTVQQVATQGNPASAVRNERNKRWVTKFSLEFSQDGNNWTEYLESDELKVFTGNFDLETVVLNSLESAVETRYIRFQPKEWHNGIAMRVEVLGLNPFSETDIVEEPQNKSPEEELDGSLVVENLNDDVLHQNQETQMSFSEVDISPESIELGLLIEERAVTPTVVHSPTPSLVSPREQKIEIEDIMESQICSQNLHLREFYDLSEVESSMSHEVLDDSRESSSVNIETLLDKSNSEMSHEVLDDSRESSSVIIETPLDKSNSEVLTSEETQELDSEPFEQENDTADINESTQPLPTPPEVNTTPHDTPPSTAPSPPPISPPNEGWAHALERACADGSIQRQLMREKMAEERRKKLAMLDSKRKRRNTEQTISTENLDELGSFLEKYCIIKKSDLIIYKNIFEKFDEDHDGFLWPEEVLEALENVNARLLNDAHLRYVFRVLEQCDCQADIGIGLRLFSLIAALSLRVASLNEKMKKLISKCDFKTLDCTLQRVKMLFECYVNQDTMRISRTDLWIGLAAGGLRSAEATIDDYFSDKHSFDFLDFLTYLPLFQEIHGYVVENPLTLF